MNAIALKVLVTFSICVQAALFVGLGWFLKRRQLEKAGLSAKAVGQLIEDVGALGTRMAADVEDHSSRITRIGEKLGNQNAQRGANPEAPALELDAITEILLANQKLQEKLAVTEQRLRQYAEKANLHQEEARHDPLSKLANRRGMDEALERGRVVWQQKGQPVSFLMLDVDRFKALNDQFGHPAGDQVIVELGRILTKHCPPGGLAARMGGEEFGVLVPGMALAQSKSLAETIRTTIAHHKHTFGTTPMTVTASLGVAQALASDDAAGLISNADRALYAAKKNGRNRSYFFHAAGCQPVLPQPHADPNAEIQKDIVAAIDKRLALSEKEREAQDRRNRKRSPFTGRQLIAVCSADGPPCPLKFFSVMCRDISPGGLGFDLPSPPDFQWIVVALGAPGNSQYVRARIAHCRPVAPDRDDCFIVGCQFTERLDASDVEASGQLQNETFGSVAV